MMIRLAQILIMELSLSKVVLLLLLLLVLLLLLYDENYIVNNTMITSTTTSNNHKQCPLSKVAILIVASQYDYPLLSYTLRSINIFMPCRHSIHIILDSEDSIRKVLAWVDINDDDLVLHEWIVPDIVNKMTGDNYFIQQYIAFTADSYIDNTADVIMFLDADSVLAAPVTCSSLFDNKGRIYQMSWNASLQHLFKHPCLGLIGNECMRSYMTTFPFLLPRRVLVPMRKYIAKHRNANDFDVALVSWFSTMLGKNKDIPLGYSLSQFNVIGNYLLTYQSHLMHQIYCPSFQYNASINTIQSAMLQLENDLNKDDDSKGCKDYIPAAVHYGWRTAGYMKTDHVISSDKKGFYTGINKTLWDSMYYRHSTINTKGVGQYTNKYGSKTIKLIEELLVHGMCLQYFINKNNNNNIIVNNNKRRNIKMICDSYLLASNYTILLHEEHNIYGGVRQPSISTIVKKYTNDDPNRHCTIATSLFQANYNNYNTLLYYYNFT